MSEILVDTIKTSGGSGGLSVPSTAGTLVTSSNISSFTSSGSVKQIKFTQFTGTSTKGFSAETGGTISELAVSITPTSSSSIIRIDAMVCGEHGVSSNNFNGVWYFDRNGTKLSAPAAGNRQVGIAIATNLSYEATNAHSTAEMVNYAYFDTPNTTSQITYTVAFQPRLAETWYLNRNVSNTDTSSYERGTSYICAMEFEA